MTRLSFVYRTEHRWSVLPNAETEMPTVAFTDSETIVSPRQVERLDFRLKIKFAELAAEPRNTNFGNSARTKKSNTFLIAALTAFVMLLLFGGAIGTWFYLKSEKTEVVQNNKNKGAVNQNPVPKKI